MWVLANLCLSVAMLAVILLIQLVHYPAFAYYDPGDFTAAMAAHQRRISWIVLPLMVGEAFVSVYLWFLEPSPLSAISLALLAAIWATTAWLQVPLHTALLKGKDQQLIQKLVRGNCWRVVGWSVKTVIAWQITQPQILQ